MTDAVVARIERVTHRYGRRFALNDLTLDIPARCMVGMIGPDGVGKSTLLGLISGVRKIQTGNLAQAFVADQRSAEIATRLIGGVLARRRFLNAGIDRDVERIVG